MAYSLNNKRAIFFYKRAIVVQLIVEDVFVTMFLGRQCINVKCMKVVEENIDVVCVY